MMSVEEADQQLNPNEKNYRFNLFKHIGLTDKFNCESKPFIPKKKKQGTATLDN